LLERERARVAAPADSYACMLAGWPRLQRAQEVRRVHPPRSTRKGQCSVSCPAGAPSEADCGAQLWRCSLPLSSLALAQPPMTLQSRAVLTDRAGCMLTNNHHCSSLLNACPSLQFMR
jgi:hypothetical protein